MKYLQILVSLALILILSMCNFSGKCTYKIFKEIPNAKKNYRIVKFFNWCGFTSSNNINLSLLRNSDSVENRDRIIFTSSSKSGPHLEHDTTVNVSWQNDSTVLIQYDNDLVIFKKDSIFEGLMIKYNIK